MRSDELDTSNHPPYMGQPGGTPGIRTRAIARVSLSSPTTRDERSGDGNYARPHKIRLRNDVTQQDPGQSQDTERSQDPRQVQDPGRPLGSPLPYTRYDGGTYATSATASGANDARARQDPGRPAGGKGTHSGFFKKYRVLLLISCLLLCAGSQAFLLLKDGIISSLSGHAPGQAQNVLVNGNTRVAGQLVTTKLSSFETGIIYPQWTPDGYGPNDTKWQQGLSNIQTQTGAKWLEMTVIFAQSSLTSKQITTYESTPSVDSFAAGVRTAKSLGYHVFVVPLMHVGGAIESWVGSVQFSSYRDQQQWFDAYWQVYQPYVIAAAQAGADQVSIGTEIEWLQQNAPASLWNTLIARVRHVFSGFITYDMNWSSLNKPLPTWMHNSQLATIGISEYLPMEDKQVRIDPKEIFNLWKSIVKPALDNVAIHLGKPVLISEIGYRDTADTLYLAWHPNSPGSPADPEEQAAAYDAALGNAVPDPHIAGMFFWGWDEVGEFKLAGQPAVTVLHSWYTRAEQKG